MRLILAIIFSVISCAAQADSFYILVGFICDKKADHLVITYDGAFNEKGAAMMATKRETQWDPWSLIKMKDDDHIGSWRTIKRSCALSNGRYNISIFPSPGNSRIEGRCGAAMSAGVKVKKGQRNIYSTISFESDCFDMESPVISRVVIKPKGAAPKITEIPQDEFYK